MTVYIEADLQSDFIEHCRRTLLANGFRVNSRWLVKDGKRVRDFEPWHWLIHYANAQARMISDRPRRIIKASTFSCPSENQAGLDLLLGKVERGDRLRPHLSRRTKRADYTDPLLSDWGIHHLHLGTRLCPKENDGMIEGTANVLFAVVTDDTFYCIAVLPHKDAARTPVWAERQLIDTVHSEWPELLDGDKIQGIDGIKAFTSDDIRTFRAKSMNVPLSFGDDATYISPGGGFVSSGNSMSAVMKANHWMRRVAAIDEWVHDNADRVVVALKEVRPDIDASWLHVRLVVGQTRLYAWEIRAGFPLAFLV